MLELKEAIDLLMLVARRLKSRRVKGGALELESVEVQVQLSETKSIENLNPKEVQHDPLSYIKLLCPCVILYDMIPSLFVLLFV